LFTVIIGVAALVAYSITEIRVNQRTCRVCGFRMSIDSPDEQCPKCGATIR
jgi:rubrerythrin